ncbi:MAG: PAS domain S-box protein, partial [Desulfuromonadaceae bacterium]
MKIRTVICLLIAWMLSALIVVWVFGTHAAEVSTTAFKLAYTHHLQPVLQLKAVSDNYRINIISTARKTRDGIITFEEARKSVSESQQIIADKWKAYLGTGITPAEQKLIEDEVMPLKKRADDGIAELNDILVREDSKELIRSFNTMLLRDIDPLINKLSALASIQEQITEQELQEIVTHTNNLKTAGLILIVVCMLLSGVLATVTVKRLFRDLGAEPSELSKIAETVANGDLSITVQVADDNRSGVLWALKVMVENLRELILKNIESLEYVENIVDSVREPMLVLHQNLSIISANRNFYETFRVTPEETINNFIYDLGNGQWNVPDLRKLLEKIIPLHFEIHNYEIEHTFQDIGRKAFLLNARQISRETVGSHIILLAMEDITGSKRLKEELLKSESHYRLLSENAPDMVWKLNSDYRVTYINPSYERLSGYRLDEIIGQHVLDFYEESALPAVKKIFQQRWEAIQQGIPVGTLRFEERLRCKNGRLLWAEINSTPVYDNYGILTGFFGITRDVTERKLAENALYENRSLLRNIINAIPDAVFEKDLEGRYVLFNAAAE